jgi:hypothetical protein
MMRNYYYFYAIIAVVTIVITYSVVLTFAALAYAINNTVEYNSTSNNMCR